MKFTYLLFPLLLLLIAACGDDDDPVRVDKIPCEIDCIGFARCENGQCACPDSLVSIAPGLCPQNNQGVVFVSYDVYPGLTDTTIVHFDRDPVDNRWQVGDPVRKSMFGKTHSRRSLNGIPGSEYIASLIYDGNLSTTLDSIFINEVISTSGERYLYRQGDWKCRDKIFLGRFVDNNTIVGNIKIHQCESPTDTILPTNLMDGAAGSFPITYHRLQN